jgi:hypothetical protein
LTPKSSSAISPAKARLPSSVAGNRITLQTVLGTQNKENGAEQFNRIANVLQKLVETEGRQIETTAIADEVINLKLFSEDDEI